MSRVFVTFSPTRAAYSARVIVVFITLTQIALLILSSNFVPRRYVSRRPRSLLSTVNTLNLCSLQGCNTKFRFCMKPRHAVMLLTVFMLLE